MPNAIAAANEDRNYQTQMFEEFTGLVFDKFVGASNAERWDIVGVLGSLVAAIKSDDLTHMAAVCTDYAVQQRKFMDLMGE